MSGPVFCRNLAILSSTVRYRIIPDKTTSGTAAFNYGFPVLTVKHGYFGTFLRKTSKKYVFMICYRVERHVSIKFSSTNDEKVGTLDLLSILQRPFQAPQAGWDGPGYRTMPADTLY